MEGERHDTKKGRARRMEKEVPRRPWWRGGMGGQKKGEEDERPAQAASRQRLLATSRHSPRTLATWEGFVKDGLKNIRTKKRRREEPHTHTHRSPTRTGPCTLKAVGLLSLDVETRGGVAPPLAPHHTSCVWRSLPYLTLPVRSPIALYVPSGFSENDTDGHALHMRMCIVQHVHVHMSMHMSTVALR